MDFKSYLDGSVKSIEQKYIHDDRGYFSELFRYDIFARHCGEYRFVQENESRSLRKGTIRGLHFQSEPHAQGKLVRCTAGALFDVAVDIRAGSPTYGQWIGETLTPETGKQLWVPPGFAHGFCTMESDTVISYKLTDYYSPACEKGLAWGDPAIGILWPDVADPYTLSPKDRKQPLSSQLPAFFSWSN